MHCGTFISLLVACLTESVSGIHINLPAAVRYYTLIQQVYLQIRKYVDNIMIRIDIFILFNEECHIICEFMLELHKMDFDSAQ